MLFIILLMAFLIGITLLIVGLSLMGGGKSIKHYSIREMLKKK